VDIVGLDNHIPQVDANTEDDPVILRRRVIPSGHLPLDFEGARNGFNHTWELDEQAIPGRLNDPTLMFRDIGIDEFATEGSEAIEGSRLVLAHESAVADDIGAENGR
jgi:hypothetical protein